MPELPEVETVVRSLRPGLVGRRISAVQLGDHSLRRGWPPELAQLAGRRVAAIGRRGKWIILDLAPSRLLIHLGMTGQFTVGPADRDVQSHTHLVADLDDGSQLRFRDPRRFGSIDYFANSDALDKFLNARLGPEPWQLDAKAWRLALAATARPIKAVLLDQAVVAGIGNIYADESLFVAKIHPAIRGKQISKAKAVRLRAALIEVLDVAIECRGSSIRDYLDGTGERGSFQNEFRAYGRTGEPCPRCKTPIACIRLAGRSTHFCPRCQRV